MGSTYISGIEDFTKSQFDFVVCGGGTAGLIVATRLTENPNVSVGVIEAGKFRQNDPLVDTPAAFPAMLGNPEYDWNYKTVPQGTKGLRHHIPRGKALGGSSAINYQMYVRGSDADYDDWAELVGDPSWGSTEMKKYMKKHQTLEPDIHEAIQNRFDYPLVGEYHGTDGPVRTSFNDTPAMPIEQAFVAAADEVTGIKKPVDPWSGDHLGFFNTLGAVARSGPNKGKRSYAARGYLGMAEGRTNLKILCEATVNKINLHGDAATGVNFSYNGQVYDVQAKKEVLVTGGAIASPQMLELSGIGNPEILQKAGVECKIPNKAVGENFQDHFISLYSHQVAPGVQTMDVISNPEVMGALQQQYFNTQGGPLSNISATQGFLPYTAAIRSEKELQDVVAMLEKSINESKTEFKKKQLSQVIRHLKSDKSANLQVVLLPITPNHDGVENQAVLFDPVPEGQPHGIGVAVCGQYPASRGSVHINSSDPTAHPTLDPAFGRDPADHAVMAAYLRIVGKFFESPKITPLLGKRVYPKPEVDMDDLEAMKECSKEFLMSEYHACGSVAMGDALDSRLKVRGTKNIRVPDASAFPNNVSGNIASSVYALAEKAADIIKADHGL